MLSDAVSMDDLRVSRPSGSRPGQRKKIGDPRLFAKKACGLGSLPVTAALLACAELAG